jgi:hypothetical protein
VAHWLDHAVRTGRKEVVIHAADRPELLRTRLEGGAFWSLRVEVSPRPAPPDAVPMTALPGATPGSEPADGAAVLRWWLDLNLRWLEGRDPAAVSIDRRQPDGGWVGPHARIHPTAVLRPPYWIGAHAEVGAGCHIGPGALVGRGAVLDEDVTVERSLVLGDTYLGAHLDVRGLIVAGALLLDPARGVRAQLADPFIAAALKRGPAAVPLADRVAAALLWLPAQLLALGAAASPGGEASLPGGRTLVLRTRDRGPLLARRAGWLGHVVAGRLRLIGPLPRSRTAAALLPADCRPLLDASLPGVFSLADTQGVHRVDDPEEAAHALYQVAVPGADAAVRRRLLHLVWTRDQG